MGYPQAYEPQYGYRYQILVKFQGERSFEHCDYAVDTQEKNYLLNEYKMAYGGGCTFKTIILPQKYWINQ